MSYPPLQIEIDVMPRPAGAPITRSGAGHYRLHATVLLHLWKSCRDGPSTAKGQLGRLTEPRHQMGRQSRRPNRANHETRPAERSIWGMAAEAAQAVVATAFKASELPTTQTDGD